MKKILPLIFLSLLAIVLLVTGCPSPNGPDNPNGSGIVSDSFFWGEWTRMDNGQSIVVKEDKVTSDGSDKNITASTSSTLTVTDIGTFTKESDSVMVCNNIPYFRKGGTNLEYKLKVVGFTDGSGTSGTTALGSVKGKAKSATYNSFESTAESDSNGEITFRAPTVNDVQTVTIENGDNEVVIPNLRIQNSGDFMGTVVLFDAGQYNLKITGVINQEDKHDGYLYANGAKDYPMTIYITNISEVNSTLSMLTIEPDDSNLVLTPSDDGVDFSGIAIPALQKGETKEVNLTVRFGDLNDPYIDTGIKIKIKKANLEWTDYIPLRFYKGTIPIAISAKSNESNPDAALNGFIIYPDGNNQFFSIEENSSKVLYVPTFGADKKYKMVFSGATVTSELSESTEMFYTVAAGSNTPATLVTGGPSILDIMMFGGDNHNEATAYDVSENFEAYLSEGEIDYYTITADTELFYSPTDSGFYRVTYASEYDEAHVPDTIIVKEGTKLTASQLPSLSQAGRTFEGWYDGTTKVNAGSYQVTDSVTLTAKWSCIEYPITYVMNNGTNGTGNPAYYTFEDAVTFTEPSKEYYDFIGWYDNADFNGSPVTGIASGSSGEKTFYAKWTPTEYTITYVLDDKGSNVIGNPSTYNIDTDDITLLAPLSDDYGFCGWFDNSTCTGYQKAKIEQGSHGDITLYAKWGEKRNVTYASEHGTQPDSIVVAEGTVLSDVQLPELTDTDYFFKGWYTEDTYENEVEADDYTVTGGDVILYAKWLKKCTITYVSTYEQPDSIVLEEGTELTATELPTLHNEGYAMKGWYTENTYANRVLSGTSVTDSMTLYAKWEEFDDGFVLVEGGTFTMGRTTGSGYSDETPTHSVTLSDFYMSPYELTQRIYTEVMGYNPSYFNSNPATGEEQEERPVECVSWYDAIYFCNKYSESVGLDSCYKVNGNSDVTTWSYTPHNGNSINGTITCDFTADGYRLPTEAEWEYAAKGGKDQKSYLYSGSDDVDDVAWYSSNSGSKTHQVGKKDANSLGIYDMSGNVWEWCWDWYGSYSSSAQTNPAGPSSGSSRVKRGGSWYSLATCVRCANRDLDYPNYRYNRYGFRLVRSSSN